MNCFEFFLSPMVLKLNFVVLKKILKIFKCFNEKKVKKNKNFQNTSKNCGYLNIKSLRLDYSNETKDCWCSNLYQNINFLLSELTVNISTKIELSINSSEITYKTSEKSINIVKLSKIMIEKHNRVDSDILQKKEKPYFSYFDPLQGFITLSKENSIESPPILTSEEPKTNLLCFNKNEVLIITLTSLSVSLSSDYYKDLLSFTFFNTNEKDKKTLTLKAIINIRDLDLIMDNFKIEGKNLSFQGTQTDFSAEIHELAFGSDYSIDSSIKLKFSLGIFSVSLKDFVFRYENFKNFQILSENFAVKGQKSCTPIKINIENCFLVVPVEKVFIIFLVSNAGIRTVLSQNVCFSLQIGTGRALMSKTNIENNENLD